MTEEAVHESFSYCRPPEHAKLGCFSLYLVRGEKFCIIGKVLETARIDEKSRWAAHKSKDGRFPKGDYRVLWIRLSTDPTESLRDLLALKEKTYDEVEIKALVSAGRRDFVLMKNFDAVVGFIRFLKGYYLYIITDFEAVGKIGVHLTYAVKRAEILPLFEHGQASNSGSTSWNRLVSPQSPRSLAEDRYKGLFMLIDLSKCFYWSDTYNLAFTLQANVAHRFSEGRPRERDVHTWNSFLCAELNSTLEHTSPWECPWTISLIHGSFDQQRCSILGQGMTMTLIARRSRFFAGTRFLKRGVSDAGNVANEVEIEQILQDESVLSGADSPSITSFVQLRGSIPTFWTQETSVAVPRPPIDSFRYDPSFRAARLHFEDLCARYGTPITIVDLVKQKEKHKRESLLGEEYRSAVRYLNTFIEDSHAKLKYYAIDFTKLSKSTGPVLLEALERAANLAWESTGAFAITRQALQAPSLETSKGEPLKWSVTAREFVPFVHDDTEVVIQRYDSSEADSDSGVSSVNQDSDSFRCAVALGEKVKDGAAKESRSTGKRSSGQISVLQQTGVARTNCIDCLDRTNVAQFSFGLHALGHQLVLLGVAKEAYIEPDSNLVVLLIRMYEDLGDKIALQYSGSGALRKSSKIMPNLTSFPKSNGIITYAKRYYSNAFTDYAKQDAMNLFLGLYSPASTPQDLVIGRKTVHIWDLESDFYLHNLAFKRSPFALPQQSVLLAHELQWQQRSLQKHHAAVTQPLTHLREAFARFGRHAFITASSPSKNHCFSSFDEILEKYKLHSVEIARSESEEKTEVKEAVQSRMGHPSVSAGEQNGGEDHEEEFWGNVDREDGVVGAKCRELYERYARQAEDPFSLFRDASEPEVKEKMKEKEQAYAGHLRDNLIHEDDAWGMKRLQAHAGNTLVLLKGPFKGMPRSLAVTSALVHKAASPSAG